MKILLFHQHLQSTLQLIEGRLLLLDSELTSIANTYIATSGLTNNQRFDCLSSKGLGPIPANNVILVDCYRVSTTPIYMPQVKGVEGNFYKINKAIAWVNGVQRGDFGVHFDANVPGSSGCVVLRTDVGWQAFEKDMKLLLTSGVKEIPALSELQPMNKLFLSIEDFYAALQQGEFDEPLALAAMLQNLTDAAWTEVEELYQPSIRVEG